MSKENAQSNFDEATRALNEKDFERAKNILLEFNKEGVTSRDIDANLGRAYYELKDYGNAVFHLERSLAHNRLGLTIRQELKLTRSKISAGYGERVAHPSEWAHDISSLIRPLEFASLASVFLLIALFFKIFDKPKKTVISTLVVALICLCTWIFTNTGNAINLILMDKTEVKSGPLKSAKVVLSVPSGTRVRVIRSSGNYAEVERPGQFRGWVSTEALSTLPF